MQQPAPTREPRRARRAGLVVLGVLSFLLVLVGGLSGGLGGGLVMLGLPLFLLGLGAAVVGSARWALIASRRVGALVCVAGLVVMGVGGAVAPADQVAPTAAREDAGRPTSPPSPDPSPSTTATATATSSGPTTEPEPATTSTGPEAAEQQIEQAEAGTALALLATLDVKGRAPRTGYDRDLFGAAWTDTDRNGCDTRNDILRRDLDQIEVRPGTNGCVVLSGSFTEPYSGRTVTFQRGQQTSSKVQIDHVVALSDAWQKGAQQWTPKRRLAFANDPLNLLAADGPLNAQKGDGDAATWLPPNKGYRCAYVARQVAVKAKYGAWVTQAERDAIARILSGCPDQKAPASDAPVEAPVKAAAPAPAPPPAPAPAPEPPASSSCDPSYLGVCIPPRTEVGDLDCGDVDHRGFAVLPPDPHRFDGNEDGVGCEG